MENRIKEQQLYLFADRTGSATMRANQSRLYFSSFAYLIMQGLRWMGLHGNDLEKVAFLPAVVGALYVYTQFGSPRPLPQWTSWLLSHWMY